VDAGWREEAEGVGRTLRTPRCSRSTKRRTRSAPGLVLVPKIGSPRLTHPLGDSREPRYRGVHNHTDDVKRKLLCDVLLHETGRLPTNLIPCTGQRTARRRTGGTDGPTRSWQNRSRLRQGFFLVLLREKGKRWKSCTAPQSQFPVLWPLAGPDPVHVVKSIAHALVREGQPHADFLQGPPAVGAAALRRRRHAVSEVEHSRRGLAEFGEGAGCCGSPGVLLVVTSPSRGLPPGSGPV